ncbi:MAG: hypothetical protein R2912_09055 [Eubacteriales bacterium]
MDGARRDDHTLTQESGKLYARVVIINHSTVELTNITASETITA